MSFLGKCLNFLNDFARMTILLITAPSGVTSTWYTGRFKDARPREYYGASVMLGGILTLTVAPLIAPLYERAVERTVGTPWNLWNWGQTVGATELARLASYPRPTMKLLGYAQTIFWVFPALLIVLAVGKLVERFATWTGAGCGSALPVLLYYLGIRELFIGCWSLCLGGATFVMAQGTEHTFVSAFRLGRSVVEGVLIPLALLKAAIPRRLRHSESRYALVRLLWCGYVLAVLAVDIFHYYYVKYRLPILAR